MLVLGLKGTTMLSASSLLIALSQPGIAGKNSEGKGYIFGGNVLGAIIFETGAGN